MSARFEPTRMQISIERYQKMVAAGVLTKYDRVELIEGEIIDMAPIGKLHTAIASQLHELFATKLGGQANVVSGGPLNLGDFSEPQPDVMLLKRRENFYRDKLPEAADALLVVEVSESSLAHDLGAKLRLYARYNVIEYWVVNVLSQRVFVHRQPKGDRYLDVAELHDADPLAPLAFADVKIEVRALFG
jgi:Uma2 family endonuclease